MNNLNNALSISNIAWDPELDNKVGAILQEQEVKFIDVAPSKYFKNFYETSYSEIEFVKEKWARFGIKIYGMQSLLFGFKQVNLFSSVEDRALMLSSLGEVCRIGRILGARFLTFGSPKNRLIKGQNSKEIEEISLNFFYKLGQIAKENQVTICLEPNPKEYGANFLTTTMQAHNFVKKLNHPNIKMQLDTGTCILNEEDLELLDNSTIGHIHASNPFLLPIDEQNVGQIKNKLNLLDKLEDKVVCIEMLCGRERSPVDVIKRSITLLRQN